MANIYLFLYGSMLSFLNEILGWGSLRLLFWGKTETRVYGGKTQEQLARTSEKRA